MADNSAVDTQQIPVQRANAGGAAAAQQHGAATTAGTRGEGVTPPSSTPHTSDGDNPAADDAAALRALAGKAVGLVIGLALLVGCSFAVEHLTAWGERFTMPAVFLVFVLVMMLASQLVVGGAGAVWAAARPGKKK
jgi:hypothetical protein